MKRSDTPRSAPPQDARRLAVALSAVALAAIVLAGCGSSSSTSSSASSAAATPAAPATTTTATQTTSAVAPSSALHVAANAEGQLKFDQSSLSAKAGKVSIAFTNMASIEHNLTIESSSGATVGATPSFQNGAKALSVDLKPGTYKFYCSVPGHRQAGMEGTLTVQ